MVHPSKNIITPYEMKRLGIDCIFTNAYIMYKDEKLRERAKQVGVHELFNYDGLIATDSGAFQQYMYKEDLTIEPKEIERFQEEIGSDFPVILDIPVQLDDPYELAKEKVLKNIERAKKNIKRRKRDQSKWIGPIHGSIYKDLLETSTLEMSKLDFGIYAIGGLVKTFIDYRFDLAVDVFINVKKRVAPNKPLHMFGLGLPQFFSLAVACGCDLMDSAAYILYARDERYFTLSTGTKKLSDLVEFPCHCPVCSNFTPKELNLFDKKLKTELIAKHNLHISYSELRTIREAIRDGALWELVETRARSHPNLIKALKLLLNESQYIEKYERRYNKRGLFFISSDTLNRPIIKRQLRDIKDKYIVPTSVKYAVILPELDAKRENSPSVNKWLNAINDFKEIKREFIHVLFMTELFGIVSLELIDSYPFGQNESIAFQNSTDEIYTKTLNASIEFIKKYKQFYEKCGLLIPKDYLNEFNEKTDFLIHPINKLQTRLKTYFKDNLIVSDSLQTILNFFLNN